MANESLSRAEQLPKTLMSSADLGFLENACTELANCVSVPTVKELRDRADALGHYVRSAKHGLELVNKVTEVKIRAERRAGELLMSMNLHGGDHMTGSDCDRITLDKLGISRWQSCRWQKIASIPEETFENLIQKTNREMSELSTAGLLRLSRCGKKKGVDIEPPEDAPQSPQHRPPSPRPDEIVSELENHCKMLGSILSPILATAGPVELREIQRRHVARLVSECQSLVCELRDVRWLEDS